MNNKLATALEYGTITFYPSDFYPNVVGGATQILKLTVSLYRPNNKKKHALGGLFGFRYKPGSRRAGKMAWCGSTNVWWFTNKGGGLTWSVFASATFTGSLECD